MGLSELPTAAAVFVVAHTVVVVLVIVCVLLYVAADDPWVRRLLHRRRRLPAVHVSSQQASGNPLACSIPGCRRCGEIFWHTRQGVVMLCRQHARRVREHLNEFLETLERG